MSDDNVITMENLDFNLTKIKNLKGEMDLELNSYVSKIIRKLFVNLHEDDISFIELFMFSLLKVLYKYFYLKPTEIYRNEFKMDNNRNIYSCINLLIPFVDGNDKYEIFRKIKLLDDLNNLINIKCEFYGKIKSYNNEYEYDENSQIKINGISLIKRFIIDNFLHLCETIKSVSHGLYVNWNNIVPISINEYKSSDIYKEALKLVIMDFRDVNFDFGIIYNTIINDLYLSLSEFVWLIGLVLDKFFIRQMKSFDLLDYFYSDLQWNNLNENEKVSWSNKFSNFMNNNSFYNYVMANVRNHRVYKFIKHIDVKNVIKIKNNSSEMFELFYQFFYDNISKFRKSYYNKILFKKSDDYILLLLRYSNALYDSTKTQFFNSFDDNKKEEIIEKMKNSTFLDFKKIINESFEILIYNGVLTKFVPLNVNSIKNYNLKNEINKNEKKWKTCHYFLTGKKYENDHFKNLTPNRWTNLYAFNWISQISFFHKYINKRVLLVTGSPGQGKSTQMPKLLLYALKMINYKKDGSIICTVPKINPTISVSKEVSLQLNTPIEIESTDKQKFNGDNFYIQYKYSDDNHVLTNNNDLNLSFVTDGVLFNKIADNIVMKKKINDKENNTHKYLNKNVYDIVIIDEAHEHNKNMDVILSFMKETMMYNNDIKLVIVSATMDDDEALYRKFYGSINDIFMYPFKSPVVNVGDHSLYIDRIFIDRRIHISPPNQTTQHEVKEHYLNTSYGNVENIDNKKVKLLMKRITNDAIEQAVKIMKTSTYGHLLFFSLGKREIIETVDRLNELLPENIIALPFYSDMAIEYKTLIEKITTVISDVRNEKSNITKEWNETYKDVQDVPKNSYKRAVIVATNVAEASITIPNLKFVVDLGYEKTVEYNSETETNVMKIVEISEMSRIQRKGRVGRTESGDAYFMYMKNERKLNKIKYKLQAEDITNVIFKILSSSKNDNYLNDVKSNPFTLQFYRNVNKNIKLLKENEYFERTNLIKITESSLPLIQNSFGNPNLIHNILRFSVTKEPGKLYFTENGFKVNDLKDNSNKIFVIDPLEEKNKINNVYNKLRINKYIDVFFVKTFFGKIIDEILMKLEYDIFNETKEYLLTFLMSIKLKCLDDILLIICYIVVVGDIYLIQKKKRIDDYAVSDISVINKFCGDIKKMVRNINYNLVNLNSLELKFKKIFTNHLKNNTDFKNVPKDVPIKVWSVMIKMYKNDRLNYKNDFKTFLDNFYNNDIVNVELDKEMIESLDYDYDKVYLIMKSFYLLKNKINNLNLDDEKYEEFNFDQKINDLKLDTTFLMTSNKDMNINNCFTYGFINHSFINIGKLVKISYYDTNNNEQLIIELNKFSSVKNIKNKILIGIPPFIKYVKIALIANTEFIKKSIDTSANFKDRLILSDLKFEFAK